MLPQSEPFDLFKPNLPDFCERRLQKLLAAAMTACSKAAAWTTQSGAFTVLL
jgi:hypothetical protein